MVEIAFEAQDWFSSASDEEVISLFACGCGGDYPADDVARHFESESTSELFGRVAQTGVGFECHVNATQAIAWVTRNRPALLDSIVKKRHCSLEAN